MFAETAVTQQNLSLLNNQKAYWNVANVQPIPEKGEANNPVNYQPIAICFALFKVLENMVNHHLVSYLESNDILSDRPTIFRRNRSTGDLIAFLSERWGRSIYPFVLAWDDTKLKRDEKCPFKDTVNLTGYEPLENGSYVYYDQLIPRTKLSTYNYNQGFRNQEWEVDSHVRGCVCGDTRYCVKFCCERGEFLNTLSHQCERIAEDLTMSFNINITTENLTEKEVDIYESFIPQVGKPCEEPKTLESNDHEWILTEVGVLYILPEGVLLPTVSYCISPFLYEDVNKFKLTTLSCPIQHGLDLPLLFNTYGMAMSVLFLVPTVLTYCLVAELRRTLPAKFLICYLISLAGSYSILSFVNLSDMVFDDTHCTIIGFTCYFSFMAAFLWLNVLCIDMWLNFKDFKAPEGPSQNLSRFLWNSLYAWGTALLMTMTAFWSQWSDVIPEEFKPGIGREYCWLNTERWSAGIYFFWPNLIIIIFNIATFAKVSLGIYQTYRNLADGMRQKVTFFNEYGLVILRLFTVLGISWVIDIISFSLRNSKMANNILMLADFCNAMQGVIIFALFVLKREVYVAIKNL
ncbi:G-protein coupled receptor Mth2-like [Stomoxys calcitrans]|uniref:G-protein coupled receptor Mth2-like n=1 Tax=Stomoxys calcitrans TaxID=35570 RepID=UPI0027E28A56|nr:G-protein coupled receptor Mth2-like [Stomoxys calcitrans]